MLSPDYIVGLTDGEGSFGVFIYPPSKKRGTKYYRIEYRYYIHLREDELPLLEKVKHFFKCGNIYFQKDTRKNHRNGYRFEISSKGKIKEVVMPFFREHLLHSMGRKNDFKLFCQIHKIAENKKHLQKQDVERINKFKAKMHK